MSGLAPCAARDQARGRTILPQVSQRGDLDSGGDERCGHGAPVVLCADSQGQKVSRSAGAGVKQWIEDGNTFDFIHVGARGSVS